VTLSGNGILKNYQIYSNGILKNYQICSASIFAMQVKSIHIIRDMLPKAISTNHVSGLTLIGSLSNDDDDAEDDA